MLDAAGHPSSQSQTSIQGRKYSGKKTFKLNTITKGICETHPLKQLLAKGGGGSWVATESVVYEILNRGYSPQTEPFRDWVNGEVLTSIRKTGSYDIAKSDTPAHNP